MKWDGDPKRDQLMVAGFDRVSAAFWSRWNPGTATKWWSITTTAKAAGRADLNGEGRQDIVMIGGATHNTKW